MPRLRAGEDDRDQVPKECHPTGVSIGRMSPRLAGFLATFLVAAAAYAGPGFAGPAAKPVGTFNGCPTGLLPVPAGYRIQARRAAAVFLHTTYARWNRVHHWGIRLAGAEVGTPVLVRHWLPSGWIEEECGKRVWLRSVVVGIGFPAMEYPNPVGPCNACAHVAFLLGRTSGGWIAWGNY